MSYRLHPGARTEHLENVAFYEARSKGLGARYLADFDATMARVCEAPQRYRVERAPNIRRARLRQFPFAVIFREGKAGVEVLAVSHHRRRPSYWQART